MMLYKLSIKNIQKSFKDYAIYFITLILGVCIFYIFNSLDSQTAMLAVSSNTKEIIKLIITVLSFVSVFVSLVLAFLIIYASRFLIKKRNREFGIYMTLGMSKRKISILLLIETFLIGIISLVLGLTIGILLSQITSILIANMFEADMSKFTFTFSSNALIKTIIYYGIIYFLVMIFNTITISKTKLIDLLQASKKQEKITLRNPIICIILFIISIIMLATAYYLVTSGFHYLEKYDFTILLVPLTLGGFGTLTFFYSISGMFLRIMSKCNNIYYKKLNSFTIKQLSSKINTMVISVSIICIMLFLTLCILSSAISIKNYFNNSIKTYAPIDFEITLRYTKDDKEITNKDIEEKIKENELLNKSIKDLNIVSIYIDPNFNYLDSFGNYGKIMKANYPFLSYDSEVEIVPISEYKKIQKMYNFEEINLKDNEYAIVANFNANFYDETLKLNSKLKIFDKELVPNKNKHIDGFLHISGNPSNVGYFVVPDEIINNYNDYFKMVIGNYKTNQKEEIKKLDNIVNNYSNVDMYKADYIIKDTKTDIKDSAIGLSALVTFIGLYLGIIFLISSSAILSLKVLSDCTDDKNKYKILRQIGVEEKDINKSLFYQTFIFFTIPLLLAIVHTIFGLKFSLLILNSLGVSHILNDFIYTFIFLIIIYGIYFYITYYCSKNIIKEK